MDFITLQNYVAYGLDDLAFGYFTPTQVKLWLNNAQKEVQKHLIQSGENWYTKSVQTSTVVNQFSYALPSDFLKSTRVELITGGTFPTQDKVTLQHITIMQQDLITFQSAQPNAFYFQKNNIILVPNPNVAQTMVLTYSYRVTDMVNDNDLPDCPEQYHEFIGILAILEGIYKDGRDPQPWLRKREYYLELMNRDAEDRDVSSPRMVVMTQDPGFGAIF